MNNYKIEYCTTVRMNKLQLYPILRMHITAITFSKRCQP